jgi:RNA polymerase sigma-70 factor (ECF subfamily)
MNNLIGTIGFSKDEDIIEKVLGGAVASFEVLIRRYNPALYKIARGYGFGRQDAEDLMQDTHVTAYQCLSQLEGRASYKTWLSKIMVSKCLYKLKYGYYKRETLTGQLLESLQPMHMKENDGLPEANILNKELAVILEKSLDRLPTIYRSVFVLREVEGFSVAETAELLQISETNVKVRLNRAKALLQKGIEQYYSHPEIYSFNLIYCDAIVQRVFEKINILRQRNDSVEGPFS